jgi:hypothetical protein
VCEQAGEQTVRMAFREAMRETFNAGRFFAGSVSPPLPNKKKKNTPHCPVARGGYPGGIVLGVGSNGHWPKHDKICEQIEEVSVIGYIV